MDCGTITKIAQDAELISGICDHDECGAEEMRTMIKKAAKRILAHCQQQKDTTDVSAEAEVVPESTGEDKRKRQQETDLLEKPVFLEERAKAGEFAIPFGKHKNSQIKHIPLDYLRWMLGFRQEGKTFQPIPADKISYIRNTHFETLANVQKYMTWRCWACGNEDTRFKHAKLCTACWHES